LGQSENFTCENSYVWILTMNSTQVSEDIVSRGLPIRFFVEGDAAQRDFAYRDPIAYARQHRPEILAELTGIVELWSRSGRPRRQRRHRLREWAATLSGVLETFGFPEFLANQEEAAAAFNVELDDLAALAEVALKPHHQTSVVFAGGNSEATSSSSSQPIGLSAQEWLPLFREAGVCKEQLDAKPSSQAKATILGNFLAKNVGRQPQELLFRDYLAGARPGCCA
jgi:hypothetical protein